MGLLVLLIKRKSKQQLSISPCLYQKLCYPSNPSDIVQQAPNQDLNLPFLYLRMVISHLSPTLQVANNPPSGEAEL